ncbi:hypothetical protein CPT_Moonbeam48 [Bacillus phage Moonbeam]|uniref:Uncharacterized protein n=1 Tax=Bacillus phage Moonbeam TaxID=1540091 RepID=A0A0A0RSF8_9CAUD|nr:hypothetical protein CPT_Moonbeam48 [Bacillus phage Moonbeam]AIW03446.1 hypothetical protein CPT_Moonbeam48 [Bacillus phage Moonbeam]
MEDYQQTYEDFWKTIVEVNGKVDFEQIKKELHDYRQLLKSVPKVYDELAGLSNPFTDPSYILARVEERMIDRETAFDDLTATADFGEVLLKVEYLRQYFEVGKGK